MPIILPASAADRRPRPTRRALTLIESSRHSVVHELIVATLGTAAQVTLVLGAVALTTRIQPRPSTESAKLPFFLAPKEQRASKPQQEQLEYVGLVGAPVPLAPNPATASVASADESETMAVVSAATLNSPEQVAIEPQRPLSEIEVDSLAERDPTSEGPAYPASLLAKQVEGVVLATFVVDSTGHADLASFVVMASTDTAFTSAVRTALPRMKYRPAVLHGRTVAQLVEQAFAFKIAKPQAIGAKP